MTVKFEKYHGNGNDFVIIDDRKMLFDVSEEHIRQLCDRRFGVGADGLMLIRESDSADFEMIYFNADGALGTMCGNGGRCIAAYAYSKKMVNKGLVIDAADGFHQALINDASDKSGIYDVSLQMLDVEEVIKNEQSYFLDTGSPHHVEFVDSAESVDVFKVGSEIRNSNRYKPGGTNVNFVQVDKENLFVRTYERGVEQETLSCGTGVTASALAAFLETGIEEWRIKTRGGEFKISFKWNGEHFSNIWLRGPAQMVFKGEIEL